MALAGISIPGESPRLTARQTACIDGVARGLSSKEIARELGISPSTVDNHIATAMHQFGFTDRGSVARWYRARESEPGAPRPNLALAVANTAWGLRLPAMGGIRNGLPVKERLFAILSVAIVSTMGASAAIGFVLGLIFLLRLAR